jgi:hypothetical protein
MIQIDTYGLPSTGERHPLCRCKVPCAGRFSCGSVHHRGSRWVPYCVGAADDLEHELGIELCDGCWCKHDRAIRAAQTRRDRAMGRVPGC